MPGLTRTLVEPYRDAISALLDSPSDAAGEDQVLEQLQVPESSNGAILETALRDEFYRILSNTSIDDAEFQRMWRLLDTVNIASDAKVCEPGFLFLLIEELLDSQTIHGCRKVFDYLESRRERLIAKHAKTKQLPVLRSCNELLKRLSRAEDTVFCGRVFIFLFQSFPLGDRSSVNLRGEYHTDNVTHYERSVSHENDPEAMVVESTTPAPGPPMIKVDGNASEEVSVLYSTFWSLQEFFANPTKLFDGTNLAHLQIGLKQTMTKFKEVYREEPKANIRSDVTKGIKRKLDSLDGSAFNPKYLTSRDMFELEIHDPAFRRHILVQALVVIDFLLSQTPAAKERLENFKNKSVIYDYVLDEKDSKWAADMRADIAAYLQQGSDGKFYYRMVDNVLSRDKNWLRWKAEGCPPFQLEPVQATEFLDACRTLQKTAAPRQLRKSPMGALDLGFLGSDDHTDSLERYRDPSRWKRPELSELREKIGNIDLDIEFEQGEEKERMEEQKSSMIWRALRVGGRFGLLDKLDVTTRDGLDPLFGITKVQPETEGEIETGHDAAEANDTVPDSEEPTAAAAAAAVAEEDLFQDPEAMEDQPVDSSTTIIADQMDGSAESSLSPAPHIDSEGPTVDNTRIADT